MRATGLKGLLFVFLLLMANAVAFAQYEVGIPVPNWTVPPYGGSQPAGGLSTMADISPGVAFVAMSPCRVFDTRNANGPYGGPKLLANTTRNFDIDSGPCTGIPSGVDAYSMNFGAILPDGANSFVTIWPTGSAQPVVSSINPIQGGVVANAAIVPAGTNGSISVFPNTGLHLYGDINGYFTDRFNPGVSFHAVSSNAAAAILGENTSTVPNAVAIQGVITSTNPGDFATAVLGINNGDGYGVHGSSVTGFGVVAGGGAGGVWASTGGAGANGVYGQHTGSGIGVFGRALGATGAPRGVWGETPSQTSNGAGVFGTAGLPIATENPGAAGVRGQSAEFGVLGFGQTGGVRGVLVDGAGATRASGTLGWEFGTDPPATSPWSFFGDVGDLGVVGVKAFVEPHPVDASKIIQYISLEGPEAGTYFRGRARFENGLARISVPEHFRMVTDPDGLTVQITPIGKMASVAVIRMDLDEIVVQSSRNVEFSYLVQGVRATFKDQPVVRTSSVLAPQSADAKMPTGWPDSIKRRMIENNTYRADGSVNMETARRLGWDKEWEKQRRPAPQPAPE
jgi:hypothetical protein